MTVSGNNTLSIQIKQKAIDLGFDLCGIAPSRPLLERENVLRTWCAKGMNGDMGYLARNIEKRINPESLVPGIGRGAQLALQALGTEERYSGRACFHRPTFPDDPDVEVEQPRRVGQAGDNLPLHWNWVLIDLLVFLI